MASDDAFFVRNLTDYDREIPGVWPNKYGAGGRIPRNAAALLGRHSGSQAPVCLESIVNSPAFKPWVWDMLMPHQKDLASAALSRKGFHAWSAAGSGKTLVGLIVLAGAKDKAKVVVTKAAARGTWQEEIRRHTNFTPVLLTGIKGVVPFKNDPKCVYITAWETLIHWAGAIAALKPHTLVMDEIHHAKNHKRSKMVLEEDGSRRFDSLGNMAAAAQEVAKASNRKLGLTATPIPNRTRDLWAQLDLCEAWQWGSFHQFGERYCAGFKDTYGWKYDGVSNEPELLERLEYSRLKTDQQAIQKSLPAKRRQVVHLTRAEQNAPSGFANSIKAARGDETTMFEVMLQEAASRKRKYVVSRVIDALLAGQKVTVFTGRRKDCDKLGDAIEKALRKATKGTSLNIPTYCAHGGTTSEARDEIRKSYMQHTSAVVLVGTGDAWGESVNLQDTDLALFVMLPWTPRAVTQWEGRFARLGQKRPVLISYIIAEGTVDEHVADVLLEKLPAVGKIAEDTNVEAIEKAFESDKSDLLSRISAF